MNKRTDRSDGPELTITDADGDCLKAASKSISRSPFAQLVISQGGHHAAVYLSRDDAKTLSDFLTNLP